MPIFTWDIIGGDSTLEFAMDILTTAGIGPNNYVARRKGFELFTVEFEGGGTWLGRHTPDEYKEFFDCLDAAASEPGALQANIETLVMEANKIQTIFDFHPVSGKDIQTGHALQVLALVLMQAGVLPVDMANVVAGIPLAACCSAADPTQRKAYEVAFNEALADYKKRNTPQAEPYVLEGGSPLIDMVAIKYRPIDWETYMMHRVADPAGAGVVPAKISIRKVACPAPPAGRGMRPVQGEELERLKEQSHEHLTQAGTVYTRSGNKVHALVGTRCQLQGLVKKPEYNGLCGYVGSYDAATMRFLLVLDEDARHMNVKEENLRRLAEPEM